MNILYLHGMASSHDSETARFIQKNMPEDNVIVPDLSIDPEIAFKQIDKILETEKIDIIIGHSLGGFMAQKYRGRKKILLNPSLGMSYMNLFVGDNKYKGARYDGIQTWHVDKRMCRQYKEMEKTEFDNITPEEDHMTIGLFGRCDFMTRLAAHRFKKHYTDRRLIPGWHYPTEDTIKEHVVPALRELYKR